MALPIPETRPAQDAPLLEVVQAQLDSMDVAYQRARRTTALRVLFAGTSGSFPTFFVTDEVNEQFSVRIVAPLKAPEKRRGAVAELIARINYDLSLGHFGLDVQDGELHYRATVDVEGGELTEAMVATMASAALRASDRFLPVLRAVAVGGVDPATALANL